MQQPKSLSEQRCTDVTIVRVQRQDGDEWRSEALILLLPRPLYWWDAEGRNTLIAATRIILEKQNKPGETSEPSLKDGTAASMSVEPEEKQTLYTEMSARDNNKKMRGV